MTDLPDKLDALAREYGPPRFRGDQMPDTLREAAAALRELKAEIERLCAIGCLAQRDWKWEDWV